MAKRKAESKISNILDSYVEFKDMDDEEFKKTFGGPKNTIINSWLYLLYMDLKEHFESQPDEEEGNVDPNAEKNQKRQERRKTKRDTEKQGSSTKTQAKKDVKKEEGNESEQEEKEDIFGINGENIKVET